MPFSGSDPGLPLLPFVFMSPVHSCLHSALCCFSFCVCPLISLKLGNPSGEWATEAHLHLEPRGHWPTNWCVTVPSHPAGDGRKMKKMERGSKTLVIKNKSSFRHYIALAPGDIETELANILVLLLSRLKDVRGRRRLRRQGERKEGHRWEDCV